MNPILYPNLKVNSRNILKHSFSHIQLVAESRQLKITDAQVTDSATYSCLAVNKAGEDQVDYLLAVQSNLNYDK